MSNEPKLTPQDVAEGRRRESCLPDGAVLSVAVSEYRALLSAAERLPRLEAQVEDRVVRGLIVALMDTVTNYPAGVEARQVVEGTHNPQRGPITESQYRHAMTLMRRAAEELESLSSAVTALRAQLAALTAAPTPSEGIKLNVTKEWCERMAALEGGHDIRAGSLAVDPTPSEGE